MKKLMMMVAMLAVSFAMQAQTKFHDVELNEAKGAVKCIKSNRMGQDIVITFSEDGKMSQQGMKDAKYDADGYLQSAKMEMMGNDMEVKRSYNEDGTLKADIMDMGGNKMESPYTNYKFDAKGNWIERTVLTETKCWEEPGEENVEPEVETTSSELRQRRVITYWSE